MYEDEDYGYYGYGAEHFSDAVSTLEDRLHEALLPEVERRYEAVTGDCRKIRRQLEDTQHSIWDLQMRKEDAESLRRRIEKGLEDTPERTLSGFSTEVWAIETYKVYDRPKCSFCNDFRHVVAKGANGQKETIPCLCSIDRHDVWRLVPHRAVATGIPAWPLVLLDAGRDILIWPEAMVDPHGKDEFKGKGWWRYTWPIFTSTESARAYAESEGLGEQVESAPERDSLAR